MTGDKSPRVGLITRDAIDQLQMRFGIHQATFLQNFADLLSGQNPVLAEFLANYQENLKSQGMVDACGHVVYSAAIVYLALDIEAQRMQVPLCSSCETSLRVIDWPDGSVMCEGCRNIEAEESCPPDCDDCEYERSDSRASS